MPVHTMAWPFSHYIRNVSVTWCSCLAKSYQITLCAEYSTCPVDANSEYRYLTWRWWWMLSVPTYHCHMIPTTTPSAFIFILIH